MINLSGDMFLWVKAFHIISVIAWLAGLLYLPRLFVYHCDAEIDSELSEKLKLMERRLMKIIMRPARILALLFGGILLLNLNNEDWTEIWLIFKLVFVVCLFLIHDFFEHWRRSFELDANIHSQRFYRIINEIPTCLFIVIVILAVIKPG